MKEKYEYLIDKYNVILIVNTKYSERNNLYSLNLAKDYINNTYIVPCDIFCSVNPFSKNELYSWYMISNDLDFDLGYCGSVSGNVPVTCGQPTIKISEILVGGKDE